MTARKHLAKLVFAAAWIAGGLQNTLLVYGIGEDAAVKYGVGAPLLLVVVIAGALWAFYGRKERLTLCSP